MNCTCQVCIKMTLANPESNILKKPEDHTFAFAALNRLSTERSLSLENHVLHN